MADYEYTSDLDISSIKKRLEQSAREFNQFADKADKAFEKVERAASETAKKTAKAGEAGQKAGKQMADGAKISGTALGVTSGIVQELTGRFLQLAGAAISSLVGVSKKAVELNANIETADRVFDAAFGDPNMGEEVLKFLDETAERFNINKDLARSFGQSILPKTDSVENFTELLRLTDIQADATGKSVEELEFAIREALSGDFVSLKDQFDIGNEQIQQIKDLTPTLGRAGALARVLGEDFARLGKVNIEGTLNTDIKAVQTEITDLQTVLGKPIFDELKDQVSDLGSVLNERGDDFELMAAAIGDVVASAVDFIGSGLTDFLQDLDTEQVQEIANNFLKMIESGRALVDVLGAAEFSQGLLDGAEVLTRKLNEALTTAIQISGLAQAEIAKRNAEVEAVAKRAGVELNPLTRLFGQIGLAVGAGSEEDRAAAAAAGEEAYKKSILETVEALDAQKEREETVAEAQKKRREEQGKETPANTQAIDKILQQNAAEKEAAKAAEELAAAQEKVNEKMEDLETDKARAELDLLVKAERAAIDAAVDAARKREDLARKNVQQIADIQAKYEQGVADAAIDASRAEEDASRDASRDLADISRSQAQKQVDIARQAAQKRLDIETQFRRKLQDIQRQFAQSALDAERNRDAVSFLQAQRERAAAIAEATTERDRGLQDVGTEESRAQEEARVEAERAREEARINAEREREDRQIENERKLEDLRAQLTRELEEQRLANEQELEEQRLAEERKAEDLATARQRDEEDLKLSLERKKQDLDRALAEELSLIKAAEAQKVAAVKSGSDQRLEIARKEAAEMKKLQSQSAASSPVGKGGNPLTGGPIKKFAAGGNFGAGESIIVGERGPEMVQFPQAGTVIPNNRLPSVVPAPAGATFNRTAIDNRVSADVSLLDPSRVTPAQMKMIENRVAAMMAEAARAGRRAGVR
jgi:hypothetical protein